MDSLLISISEVARLLGVSLSVAYRLSRSAGFPVVRIGRRRLVDREGLREWIRTRSELSQENL